MTEVNHANEPSIMDELRSKTKSQHHRVEALLGLPQTLGELQSRLEKFFGFHVVWESLLASQIAPFASLDGRTKSHLLRADLAALGMAPAHITSLPTCQHLPIITDVASALGSMYVLEGSTLGGQVISRHLESTLGLHDGHGYSYFRSYGSDVGRKWQAFRAELESQSRTLPHAAILNAATQTFDALHNWFTAS